MKQQEKLPQDPDIRASLKALRRAARRALQLGIKTGTPVYVLRNSRIVDLTKRKRSRARMK